MTYINEEIGWITFENERKKSDFHSLVECSIAPSTFGDRYGMFVFQTNTPNTVDLATCGNITRLPAIGVIIKDKDTSVIVQTENINTTTVQLDSISANPEPGDFVFLSQINPGCCTNIEPESGIVQRLGTIKQIISQQTVIINYFPKPEYIINECDLLTRFGEVEFIMVAAGEGFQLILDATGRVWGYGENSYGQLGLGHTDYVEHPTSIDQPCPVDFIDCGYDHSVLIDKFGYIWVMGRNDEGQLGLGHNDPVIFPTKLIVEE